MSAQDLLAKFGIPPELLEAADVRQATDTEVRERLGVHGRIGQDLGGIVFPYTDPRNGRVLGHRVRLDTALTDGQKYLSEQGCRTLFFPPGCGNELGDTSVPVVIVEAEKSALAVAALASRNRRKMLSVAVGGVWGWKRKTGVELTPDGNREPVTGPSPSLDWIVWKERKVVFAFDSNVAPRPDLQKAQLAFAEELRKRGAQVFIASIPQRNGVNGPDDLIAVAGDGAAIEMFDRAGMFEALKSTPVSGFRLIALRDLLNEPEEKVSWVLADKLPAGGISVLSAKPKVGKSTLARCLALAIARGETFLGCATTEGAVIYLALEEKRSEVRRHFADLGATGDEPIHIHCAAAPKDAMPELCKIVTALKPVLVIIDPLFKFLRVADEKVYAETCQAIEPLLTLARQTGAHVLLVHHNGKAERADATDAILGSTAIFGGVDAALILKRTDRYRTLQSSQRYGTDWSETVLEFEAATRSLSLGAEKSEAEAGRIGQQVLDYLGRSQEARTREEIEAEVEGDTGPKRKALRFLVEQGKVERSGTGKRGDPLSYRFLFSCLQHIEKTSKQDSSKGPEGPENTEDILVCDSAQDSLLVSGDGEVRL